MSEACTHNCETCGQSCAQRSAPQNMMERPHPMSSINRVIGVVSGKGGVGKSLITSLLAVSLQRKGYHTAILDADITGPVSYTHLGIGRLKRGRGALQGDLFAQQYAQHPVAGAQFGKMCIRDRCYLVHSE